MEEALLLARVQFGLNIAFHILFPTITIGLAWLLVVFRLRYERTRDPAWLGTYKLWVKVFALTFAMGVVSGITMSFQFGTNWPGYMNKVGNVAGPAARLRGADRVLPRGHVPRRDAVRHEQGFRPDARRLHHHRRRRHHAVRVLDPGAQLVDADAGRPRDGERRADRGQLARR